MLMILLRAPLIMGTPLILGTPVSHNTASIPGMPSQFANHLDVFLQHTTKKPRNYSRVYWHKISSSHQPAHGQVELHPDDKEKSAFNTPDGLFEFNVMPYGLSNAHTDSEEPRQVIVSCPEGSPRCINSVCPTSPLPDSTDDNSNPLSKDQQKALDPDIGPILKAKENGNTVPNSDSSASGHSSPRHIKESEKTWKLPTAGKNNCMTSEFLVPYIQLVILCGFTIHTYLFDNRRNCFVHGVDPNLLCREYLTLPTASGGYMDLLQNMSCISTDSSPVQWIFDWIPTSINIHQCHTPVCYIVLVRMLN